MTERIRLKRIHTDEYAASLRGQYVDESHYIHLIGGEDVDVIKPDGSLLLALRAKRLTPGVSWEAYPALKRAATQSLNRGAAAGGKRYQALKLDGSRSNTHQSDPALSGIIGNYERTPRILTCRTTEFTRRDIEGWRAIVPYIRCVDDVFRHELPERHAAQMSVVAQTPPEWVIDDTAFTTVTVNRNWRTAVHKDEGDLPEGFGVMSVIRCGHFSGGYLVFPQYRVAVDMDTQDVLLADVHEWHGNSPIFGVEGEYERISTVFYYRTKMRFCGTAAEELHRAKRRKPGEDLF